MTSGGSAHPGVVYEVGGGGEAAVRAGAEEEIGEAGVGAANIQELAAAAAAAVVAGEASGDGEGEHAFTTRVVARRQL